MNIVVLSEKDFLAKIKELGPTTCYYTFTSKEDGRIITGVVGGFDSVPETFFVLKTEMELV